MTDALSARIVPVSQWLEAANAITVPVPGVGAAPDAVRFTPYLALVEDVRLLCGDWLLLSAAGDLLIVHLPPPISRA